ncbi:MAG: SLBB domain-containing protein, partial [Lachnospiraceae bacterium]|nr:SLBB domain-containing protein [Lachnospiraceae bacterium]
MKKIEKSMALFAMVFLILNGCGKSIIYVESTAAGTESSAGPESLPASPPEWEESSDGNSEEADVSSEELIYVYVCGAVENPGVYELKAGARVYEAVA